MTPFYGWGSNVSMQQPLRGGNLLFTTKFQIFLIIFYRPQKDESTQCF